MELIFPILLIGMLYFLMIRPQRKRMAERQALINSITRGDEVVTAGGIHGVITDLDESMISLEIASGTVIRVDRGAVAGRVGPEVDALDED